MNPERPWSIESISPELRDAAEDAARRSGVSLDEWISSALRQSDAGAATVRTREDADSRRYRATEAGDNSVRSRIDELSAQLNELARRQAEPAIPRVVQPKIDLDPVSEAVRGLVDRVERSERQSARVLEEFGRRLDQISEPRDHRDDRHGPARSGSGDSGLYHASEQAMRDLVEQIERSERRTNETVRTIEERMNELGRRLTSDPGDRVRQESAVLNALEGRISDLSRRLEQAERRPRYNEDDAVERKLAELADRVAQAERARGNPAQGRFGRDEMSGAHGLQANGNFASRTDLQRIQRHINDIVARLDEPNPVVADRSLTSMQREIASLSQSLSTLQSSAASNREVQTLKQAIDNISAQLKDASRSTYDPTPALDRIQGEVKTLSQSIADLTINTVSPKEMQALREGLEEIRGQLHGHMAEAGAGADTSQMREEISAINEMLAQIRNEAASASEVENLRALLDQMSAQVGSADSGSDREMFQALEYRLSELSERLDQTAQQSVPMSQIIELENRLQDLDARISSQGGGSDNPNVEALEAQISALSDRLTAAEQRGFSGGDVDVPAIEALERGLQAVQANAETADKRTQETLEAVHETLQKVVTRLASLDDAPEGTSAVMSEAREALSESLNRMSDIPAVPDVRMPPVPDFQVPPRPEQPAPPQQAGQIEPTFAAAPDIRLDPVGSTAQEPAAPPLSGITRTDDFIAAARRAAQAANTTSAPEPKKSRFSFNLLSRGAKKDAPADKEKEPKSGTKRTILLAAAAALLAIGALSSMNLMSGKGLPVIGKSSPPVIAPDGKSGPAKALPGKANKVMMEQSNAVETISPVIAQDIARVAPPPTDAEIADPISEVIKTSATGAPAGGIPNSSLSLGSAPETTASIPANPDQQAASAGPVSVTDFVSSSLMNAEEETNHAPVATQETKAPAAPVVGSIQQALPPAEIGPMDLRVAAASGDPKAQFEIAVRYTDGKLVEQDFRKAAFWYQKAAAKGLAPAQYRLGTLYEKGRGVPKDNSAARIWYERAAEKGNAKAMHNLAVIYASKSGDKPNFQKAALWFKSAAELGLTDSQFNLGVLHERGLGVQQDFTEAYKWFSIASERGDKGARDRMPLIERRLTQEEVLNIKLSVEDWMPNEQSQAANVVVMPEGGWGRTQTATPADGASSQMISHAQSLLNDMGYRAGPPDGILGPQTRDAIRAYQREQGLAATGAVTTELLEALANHPG